MLYIDVSLSLQRPSTKGTADTYTLYTYTRKLVRDYWCEYGWR